jgi:arylformamidase
LGGVVRVTDWSEYRLPANTVKDGVLFSGMYELEPVSLSARNEYLDFNEPGVKELLSAQRRLAYLNAPVVIAHGSVESPEFIRQSKDFADAVRAAGKRVKYIVGTGYNRFEFPDTFANPYGALGRAALEMMRLPVSGKHLKDDNDRD